MKKKITGKKSDPGEGLFDAKKVFLKGVSAVIDQVNEPARIMSPPILSSNPWF